MKKNRDCNCNNTGMTPYPVYPAYIPGTGMPMMAPGVIQDPNMMMQPNMLNNNFQQGGTTIEQQLYTLSNQVNSLEKRVSSLEALANNSSTQYNTSNYQVM